MAYSTITNDKRAVYVDCSPAPHTVPDYARFGEGIDTITPSINGKISTKHYVNDINETSRRNGTGRQWAWSGDRVIGDKANDFVVSLSDKVGAECETTILIADLIEGEKKTGGTYYVGRKYDVMVDVGNDGSIVGGDDVAIDGTFKQNGDYVEGYVCIGAGGEISFVDSLPSS